MSIKYLLKKLVAVGYAVPRVIRYSIIFIAIQIILFMPPWQHIIKENHILEHHETEILYNSYSISVESYRKATEILYKEVINRQDILYWVAQANTTDKEQQNKARQQLYQALKSTYDTLQGFDLHQFHFHLPDGTSLLRFHRPDKFGDNLFSVRYSVKLVNETQKPVQGFEEGRVYNGFRYVFPLFYQGAHIGSVETSASFRAVAKAMQQVVPHEFRMILKKSIIEAKLYREERDNYCSTLLSDDYIEELDVVKLPARALISKIDQQVRPEVRELLQQEQGFVLGTQVETKNYLVVFVPMYNIQQQMVGYLVSYHQSDALAELKALFYKNYLELSIINILMFAFFIIMVRSKHQIEERNIHLNALIREKNELMGIVAHDLKNPLSAIQGYAEELHDEATLMDDDEIRLYAGKIQESARRTFSLIGNLLDVNALESGKIRVVMEKTRLDNILAECIARHRDHAAQKHITLELSTSSHLIMTDIQLFQQIMDNLISNAIKYSQPQKKVHVHVYKVEDKIHCVVEDQGPGLSAEDQAKLFGKFTRLTPTPTAGEHSTGLGLFIVKKLVDTLEGKVWCESELGCGSRFIVQLRNMDKSRSL